MPQPVDAAKTALSVGEVARRCQIPVSTVHYYEAQGLISGWRNNSNHRRYGRHVLRRIALIKIAQRVGVPLQEIDAALQQLPADKAPTAADWQRLSRYWRQTLQQRIDDLTLLRDQMNDCIGCGCLSLQQCPLRNPGDCRAG